MYFKIVFFSAVVAACVSADILGNIGKGLGTAASAKLAGTTNLVKGGVKTLTDAAGDAGNTVGSLLSGDVEGAVNTAIDGAKNAVNTVGSTIAGTAKTELGGALQGISEALGIDQKASKTVLKLNDNGLSLGGIKTLVKNLQLIIENGFEVDGDQIIIKGSDETVDVKDLKIVFGTDDVDKVIKMLHEDSDDVEKKVMKLKTVVEDAKTDEDTGKIVTTDKNGNETPLDDVASTTVDLSNSGLSLDELKSLADDLDLIVENGFVKQGNGMIKIKGTSKTVDPKDIAVILGKKDVNTVFSILEGDADTLKEIIENLKNVLKDAKTDESTGKIVKVNSEGDAIPIDGKTSITLEINGKAMSVEEVAALVNTLELIGEKGYESDGNGKITIKETDEEINVADLGVAFGTDDNDKILNILDQGRDAINQVVDQLKQLLEQAKN